MIKVELGYNPYIMETMVKFDGHEPHINSLVEKYQHGKLQDWIRKIPYIFYDEMNGYDFELEFSGPKIDYEQLEEAFADAGVEEDQVKLFHKNELSSREKKVQSLRYLIKWLAEEPNNTLFNLSELIEESGGELEREYTFITINGEGRENPFDESLKISIEDITAIEKIDGADLTNVPIIIYITKDILPVLQTTIKEINSRDDIDNKQLFFVISDEINQDMIKRTIVDLGVKELQVVDSISDKSIVDYYYTYPVTEQLRSLIDIIAKKSASVEREVNRRKEKSIIINSEIYGEIEKLNYQYALLNDALINLQSRDNLEIPAGCIEAYNKLINSIELWRRNKVRFSEEYGEKNAIEFNQYVHKIYDEFASAVTKVIAKEQMQTIREYDVIYRKSENDEYKSEAELYEASRVLPSITLELLAKKEEKYVAPKSDLKEKLFGDDGNKEREEVLVTTYYCQEWRIKALEIVVPIAHGIIRDGYKYMRDAVNRVATDYISRLEDAIKLNIEKTESASSKLSADESRLQEDIKWSTTLNEAVTRLQEVRI